MTPLSYLASAPAPSDGLSLLGVGLAIALALIAAFGAVALDRRFHVRDARLDVYLEWLRIVDTQEMKFEEALSSGDPARIADIQSSFKEEFLGARNRLAFLASKKTAEAVAAHHVASSAFVQAALQQGKEPKAIFQGLKGLSERDRMLAEMRRDVRGRWWPHS